MKTKQNKRNSAKPKANARNSFTRTPTARTTSSVEQMLRRAIRPAAASMSSYVHCRADPFSSDGKGMIPDGGNNNFVVMDMRQADYIEMNGETTFAIQTLPTLPCSALISVGPLARVNGATAGVGAQDFNCLNPGNMPLSIMPQFKASSPNSFATLDTQSSGVVPGSSAPPGSANNPFSAVSGRMVAIGYRLTYTGPANTCSGTIQVTPAELSVSEMGLGANANYILKLNDSNNSEFTWTKGVPAINVAIGQPSPFDTSTTRDSVFVRPEQGLYILPKHKTSVFRNRSFNSTVSAMFFNADAAATTVPTFFNAISANSSSASHTISYGGGVLWYDDDWTSLRVVGHGLNTNASFRWDTIWCFEFNPVPGSAFSNFTIRQSPLKTKEVTKSQKQSTGTPIATGGGETPTTTETTTKKNSGGK